MAAIQKVLHLVDQVSAVNFGIWHAAIAPSESLLRDFGIQSWLVAPENSYQPDLQILKNIHRVSIKSTSLSEASSLFSQFSPLDTIVVSHGCWQYPTKWANYASSLGFKWMYVPHGMLEPWSMEQKKWKKWLYFYGFENRMAQKADWVRAVGKPELINLKRWFPHAIHIPNGIYETDLVAEEKPGQGWNGLFLARLHFKKGIMPLVKAWVALGNERPKNAQLTIAGTDDGEQAELELFLKENPDEGLRFLGPRFGDEKRLLLAESHFYILPSMSEGFPVSVVEAMGAGLIPIISMGCNFPEILEEKIGIETGVNQETIEKSLRMAFRLTSEERKTLSLNARAKVREGYLWSQIAADLFKTISGK